MRKIRLYIVAGVAFLIGFPLAEVAEAQAGDVLIYTAGFSLTQLILGLGAQS